MDWADQRLAEAEISDLLVIDELGPVEFFQGKGLLAGMERLDQGEYRVACVVVRSALLPNALQRWPNAIVVNGGSEGVKVVSAAFRPPKGKFLYQGSAQRQAS